MPRTRGCFSKEAGEFSPLPSAAAVEPAALIGTSEYALLPKEQTPLPMQKATSNLGEKKVFANTVVSFKLFVTRLSFSAGAALTSACDYLTW